MHINIFVTSYTSITMLAFFQYWLVRSLNTACDWMCSVKSTRLCQNKCDNGAASGSEPYFAPAPRSRRYVIPLWSLILAV